MDANNSALNYPTNYHGYFMCDLMSAINHAEQTHKKPIITDCMMMTIEETYNQIKSLYDAHLSS